MCFAETERYANEVIAYCATLGESVGSGYKDLSLDYLADFWLDESSGSSTNAYRCFETLTSVSKATSSKLQDCFSAPESHVCRKMRYFKMYKSGKLDYCRQHRLESLKNCYALVKSR